MSAHLRRLASQLSLKEFERHCNKSDCQHLSLKDTVTRAIAFALRQRRIIFVYLGASYVLSGQAPDTRLDDAVKEIAQLKRMAADQDRRIATLENTVRLQQRAIVAAARPSTVPVLSWRTLEGWVAVKVGMSRAQVVEILGEPKSTDIVMDRQTLFYRDAAAVPIGEVVITDDRVSEINSTAFQIQTPSQK